ncbi:MAG TPA: MFS transporter [Candidatus Dormibacteraeota bacterium]|nr:MFS transporter [Candidatus Dormibacteraeota bacterium]
MNSNSESRLRGFMPVLALLALAILINYVDRGNLSIAAPALKDELHLSGTRLGLLFSAFFFAYTAFIFVNSWLVDRFAVNWVLAGGFALWSLATTGTGLVTGFATLFLMRLLLGMGESVAFPTSSKILAQNLPECDRGFANGLICCGMKLGPAAGIFGAGMLMAKFGWRPVFIGIGLISLLWLPAWFRWMPRRPAKPAGSAISGAAGYADVLRQPSFWGASAGHFCFNYLSYFLVSWLPFYLVHERQLAMTAMVKTAGAYYVLDALSAFGTGWLTDFLIRRGASVTVVRKGAMFIGASLAAAGLAGCAMAGPQTYLWWLAVLGVGSGMGGAGIFTFAQTLAGPRTAGRWAALQNGFGNLSGWISPALTGYLLDRTGHFTAPLAIAAIVCVIGGLAWVFGVGRLEAATWAPVRAATLAPAE